MIVYTGEVEHQETNQHENAAKECIQQEFPCRVDASRYPVLDSLTPPNTDQQEHRGQLDFPEEEEEKQIEGQEDTHHASFQDEQQRHIFFDAYLLPAANDSEHRQQRVENDHWQAKPVNPQEIVDLQT